MVQKFSGVKIDLWHWLEEEVGNQNGSFEINQSALAEKFDVSRKSIQNALKTFCSANLLEKVESRTGRGNHPLYRLIWTFKEQGEESATPSRVECTTPRKRLTKGRQWRYYAYKFRTTVENSSLANRAQTIVGKILNYLEGKPRELFQRCFSRLKHWLNGPPRKKTIKDFFVFFHDGLMKIARSQMEVERTERRIRKQQKQREEVRAGYEKDPPPRRKNYASFAEYQQAVEKWHQGHDDSVEGGGDEPDEDAANHNQVEQSLTDLLDQELSRTKNGSGEGEPDKKTQSSGPRFAQFSDYLEAMEERGGD